MKRINTHQAVTQFQKKRIRKIYFVSVQYHNIKNPYAVDYREVRKSLLYIDQLWENINYLKQFQINSYAELLDREAKIKEQEKALKNQIYNKDFLQDNEAYIRYKKLKEMLSEVPESDDSFEKILDELEELEQDFPDAILDGSEKVEQMEKKLQSIRDEKRIIRQIKKEEEEDKLFYTAAWGQPTEHTYQNSKKKEVQTQWAKTK